MNSACLTLPPARITMMAKGETAVATCPHCKETVDCHGLSGPLECPHCRGQFLYRPRRPPAEPSLPLDFLRPAVPCDHESELARFLDSATPSQPVSTEEPQEPLGFLGETAPTEHRPAGQRQPNELPGVFDFGFRRFVTPGVVRALWVISVVAFLVQATVGSVLFVLIAINPRTSWTEAVACTVGWALMLLLAVVSLLLVRVFLECTMVFFRISAKADSIDRKLSSSSPRGTA